jgi:Tfp pilus assembly protein PilF
MKKAIIVFSLLGCSLAGMAQDKYVVSASVALNANNLDEAKENIDKAWESPEVKEKPKALFVKGEIYLALQVEQMKFDMSKGKMGSDKYKGQGLYKEGTQSLMKLTEVKADYERSTTDQLLFFGANCYYNDGVKIYNEAKGNPNEAQNEKKYSESGELIKTVIKIHDLGSGKRFEKFDRKTAFDTIFANSNLILANEAYTQKKYEDAIPLLIKVKNNDISKSPSVYECLIDAYNNTKNSSDAFATIEEGRKLYPNDVTLRNSELNYFIKSGKMDDLIKKLEEAAANEPNNADIEFNIATTYGTMANATPKPANSAELMTKAEDAYQKALKIAPENLGYNYNFGAFYFNQAKEISDQMRAITGLSDADTKKYDALKVKLDAQFNKALPFLEKAYSVCSANEGALKNEDLKSYKGTLMALSTIYGTQNKADKAKEMTTKLNSLK